MRGRGGPIIKNHIKVSEAKVDELPGIIYLCIEAYNCGNVHFLQNRDHFLRAIKNILQNKGIVYSLMISSTIRWGTKRNEFVGDYLT